VVQLQVQLKQTTEMYIPKQQLQIVIFLLVMTKPGSIEEILNNKSLETRNGSTETGTDSMKAGNGPTKSETRIANTDHHCIWYDKCGPDPDFHDNVHILNCVYEGKAGKSNSAIVESYIVITVNVCIQLIFSIF
jgi:hypothetical protein